MGNLKGPKPTIDEAALPGTAGRSTSDSFGRVIHVCFMIDELRTGGTETQLLRLIDNLNRRKFQPYLCLLDGNQESSRQLEPSNCPVVRLGVRRLMSRNGISGAWRLVRFLKQHQVDILQVHFPDSTYLGIPAAKLAGVRCIIRTRRDLFYWVTPIHKRWGRYLDRFYNRHWVTALAVNCVAVKDKAIEDEGLGSLPVEVIPNAMDFARYNTHTRRVPSDNSINIGAIAMLRPEKRLDVLVEAARIAKIRSAPFRFFVAGEGPERNRLEALIERYGLQNTVHLLGRVDDIPGFLNDIDIGVLTSESEGLSNAIIECMAAGIPVVATSVGGNVELIEEGKTGRLFQVNNVEQLAEVLAQLAGNAALREEMGREAASQALELFSVRSVMEQYESLYERLLA